MNAKSLVSDKFTTLEIQAHYESSDTFTTLEIQAHYEYLRQVSGKGTESKNVEIRVLLTDLSQPHNSQEQINQSTRTTNMYGGLLALKGHPCDDTLL